MTLRRWGWLPARVALVGLVRIPLLFARPIADDPLWLLLLVAGVPALSGFVGAAVLVSRRPRICPLKSLCQTMPFLSVMTSCGWIVGSGRSYSV